MQTIISLVDKLIFPFDFIFFNSGACLNDSSLLKGKSHSRYFLYFFLNFKDNILNENLACFSIFPDKIKLILI